MGISACPDLWFSTTARTELVAGCQWRMANSEPSDLPDTHGTYMHNMNVSPSGSSCDCAGPYPWLGTHMACVVCILAHVRLLLGDPLFRLVRRTSTSLSTSCITTIPYSPITTIHSYITLSLSLLFMPRSNTFSALETLVRRPSANPYAASPRPVAHFPSHALPNQISPELSRRPVPTALQQLRRCFN